MVSLRSLGRRVDEVTPEVSRAVSLFVRSLQCVESVSVDVLDMEALEHICRLPSLTSLYSNTISTASTFFINADTQSFVSLRTLDLGNSEIEPTTRFLEGCNQIPLISFDVSFPHFSTAGQMHKFYTAIAAVFSPSSLTSLTLDNSYNVHAPPIDHVIQSRSIRMLFGFVNLTSLYMLSPIGIDWDDSTVLDLARAWPRIETLDLSAWHCASARPRVTLECLRSFARHCPHLGDLTTTFDGTVIPTSDLGATNRVCQVRLRSLNVDHSTISTAVGVARFLSAIFPNLKHILTREVQYEEEDLDEVERQAMELHLLWNEVQKLLPEVSAIREERRVWATNNASGL
ncbi:hypothetical protein C8R44DRAFT_761496 [Mycena epipterygia]|nr:hypothetical protein C8R44DRAFT_761496 [Mycena epipterygia]